MHCVAIDLERARKLGQHLRLEVAIDRTHWLRREVELVFTRNPDGTLRPVTVRVGREASDEEVVADGGVVARCEQYNAALGRLRQLATQLTEAVLILTFFFGPPPIGHSMIVQLTTPAMSRWPPTLRGSPTAGSRWCPARRSRTRIASWHGWTS